MILAETQRKRDFVSVISESRFSKFMIPYLIVITYTMVLRADINAFLNPFIELFCLYLMVYLMKYEFGFEKTFSILRVMVYILMWLGVVEYIMGRSPFSYLETIKGIYTGQFIRNGHYRIMSSAVHSLGYGLMIMCMGPFACYDEKKKEIKLFARPVLLVLMIFNVFMTGSRSTLAVFVLELVVILLFSRKKTLKRTILQLIIVLLLFAVFEMAIYKTSVGQYIMLQITSVLDEVLGTQWSVNYGADLTALSSSSNYRDQLKYIFKVDWLNPILGIGRKKSFSAEINGSYILSIDNFYIAEFVRYAYPGLITYVLFLLYFICSMIKKAFGKTKNVAAKIILIACTGYLVNLKWVDSLQTLKYLYVLFALFEVIEDNAGEKETDTIEETSKYKKNKHTIQGKITKKKSKYIKNS